MRKFIIQLLFCLGFGVSAAANAQTSDLLAPQTDSMSINAGAKFTLPFGGQSGRTKRTNNLFSQARFGLTLDLGHTYTRGNVSHMARADLLEFGWTLNGSPNVRLYGQDMSPLFTGPLMADEGKTQQDYDNDTRRDMAFLYAGGAILVAGVVVAINEAADDISDCFFNFTTDDPKCR